MNRPMEMYTTGQVARKLGISPVRVAQLREKGEIAGVRTPLGFLYDRAELTRLLKFRSQRARTSSLGGGQ